MAIAKFVKKQTHKNTHTVHTQQDRNNNTKRD